MIWVTVANPGQPIAEAYLPRLFDRFYRVDAARQTQGEHHGYGLGLALVKAVARMHGGSVTAACSAGITTIGFSLSAPNRQDRPQTAMACRQQPTNALRVLPARPDPSN